MAQNTKSDWTPKTHINFTGDNLSATTTLTITLNAIQSISVNTSDVRLIYNTVSDYTQGVQSGWITDHLKVFSTGGYSINVKYLAIDNNYMDNTNDIFEQSYVQIAQGATIPLRLQDVELLGSNEGDFNKVYSVNYIGGKNYTKFTTAKGNRVVKATVTYTIVPK